MMSDEWQCTVCGYIHKGGSPPQSCPSCGAPFTAFERCEADPKARFRDVEMVDERPSGYRYVIVGNSAAGRSATRAIQALHADGEITIVSEETAPFYMRPLLPDFIGGMEQDRVFGVGSDESDSGLTVILGDAAKRLDVEGKQVICSSGRAVPFDALLLATGSAPVRIPWPGSDATGIAYLRTFADAEQIASLAGSAERAVVVGGGFLGLEFVRAFVGVGLRVTHLIRGSHVGSPALDAPAGELIRQALEDAGVTVALEEEVESFRQGNGRVCGVRTSKGRTIECHLVGVAVGARPRVELAQEAGLELDRGVLVDGRFRTAAPHVYAGGDVAQACDLVWGERRINTSWRNAREQGELAGTAMAGGAVEYSGGLGSNYQRAGELAFCVLGIANPPDEDRYEVQWDVDEKQRTYRKTVERDGVLVGALLVGDLSEAGELERGIREGMSAADAAVARAATPEPREPKGVEPALERKISMREMTEKHLKESFAGESQAHMKYLNFAEKATAEGRENVARLFRAASFAEQVHASEQLAALEGIGSTSENLAAARAGENFEVEEMYPAFMMVAEAQGEALAQRCFRHALEAEKMHRELYERAKKAVDADGDPSIDEIWVCSNCGYTLEGEAPETCPVCGAPKKDFVKF